MPSAIKRQPRGSLAERVQAERVAQGLAPVVQDAEVLRRLAALLKRNGSAP